MAPPDTPCNTPPAEVDITAELVEALLVAQHPDLASLPLSLLGQGWDNAMYRLGRDLVVRLPRRAAAASLIAHEQRWLPALTQQLPLPVPAPVRIGRPSADAGRRFPWHWSVLPWFDGRPVGEDPPPADRAAKDLGRLQRAVGQRSDQRGDRLRRHHQR